MSSEASPCTSRGILTAPIDLDFDLMTQELLESTKEAEIVIDLCGVLAMNSMYLGAIAAVAAEARREKRELLVRARKKVGKVMLQCGFHRILKLQEG